MSKKCLLSTLKVINHIWLPISKTASAQSYLMAVKLLTQWKRVGKQKLRPIPNRKLEQLEMCSESNFVAFTYYFPLYFDLVLFCLCINHRFNENDAEQKKAVNWFISSVNYVLNE